MKLSIRIFFLVVCTFFLLLSSQVSYAEETATCKEVTSEATYRMGESDTPAKAEEQALLRAKRNALEQVSSLTLTAENIAALPSEVFTVTVLDKKKTMNGDAMECWVKIQAVIYPDKLETTLKQTNSIWGGPAEYYQESVMYANGKEISRTKSWTKNNWERIEMPDFTKITKYEKTDKVITDTSWSIKNNKYFEESTYKMEIAEEILGTEMIGAIAAQKKRLTYTYIFTNMPSSKFVTLEWVDPATKLTVKMQSETNGVAYVTLFQNAKIGPQDPALFEIPKGYARCATIEELYRDANAAPQPAADPFSNLFDTILQNQVDKAFDKVKIK